jgi:RNA polymerase sigma factor (sigma-70 family)
MPLKKFVRFFPMADGYDQTMEIAALTDTELLTAWVKHRDETAFHTLVSRYAGLVHSAAKRACGDDSLAAEASQLTFILLTRKAKSLLPRASLGGWLYLTAAGEAKNLLRSSTRENRKRSALLSAMAIHTPDAPDPSWQEIQPFLNDALAALSEKDRETIILRFYRSLSVKEIAASLGIANDAAQKRLDRATERLREKLTRRGVTTAGSLSATMIAGFSTDAQAAVICTSILSSKAIAAAPVVSSGVLTTLFAMKASNIIAPAVILLLSGTWLVRQRIKISDLNQRSDSLEMALAASSPDLDQKANPTLIKRGKDNPSKDSTNLQRMIADYKKTKASSIEQLRFYNKYSGIFNGMSAVELGSLNHQLLALGTTDGVASDLANWIMPALCTKDFPYAFEHFETQLLPEDADRKFSAWAKSDPTAARLWLDQQVASGKLESKSLDKPNPLRGFFERSIFRDLFLRDPAAAADRVAALPESERKMVFPERWESKDVFTEAQLLQMAGLIRSYLPVKDQANEIATLMHISGTKDVAKTVRFLDTIEATPVERRTLAMDLAFGFYNDKLSIALLDQFRTEISSFAPQHVDAATGHALAAAMLGDGMSFNDAAALALHYHEAGAGDDILIHLCGSQGGKDNKAAARIIAEKISHPKRRAALLNQLK